MKARFKFDRSDNFDDRIVANFPTFLRKGDVVALDEKYYLVEAGHYDLTQNEAVFWLESGMDEHPTAPYE